MKDSFARPSIVELWGGPECTVNRVGDTYFDQFARTGHLHRIDDLDRFASLGITALRYPVLWERIMPEENGKPDWSWTDQRLERIRELGMRPIVGLVHHGSGPRHTNLAAPDFPAKLAQFARQVAERYPWIEDFTPINEPLTTARFSGLYGHWYPHGRDDRTFIQILLHECRAVALAMTAIREVIPEARLVQTDDLGKTYSTPALSYQARFDNERRWLSFDLLCGKVDANHPLAGYLRHHGAEEQLLDSFLEEPCPPNIIGINHYLSSERYLDENLDRYPVETHGGNGRQRYADVLASRVRAEGVAGPRGLLQETWDRYGLPIAVTEAHNACTREESLRWLIEVWDAAESLARTGTDIRAVTVWSLLGADGWNKLVASEDGRYEPGVFDLRSPQPRATALTRVMRQLACGTRPEHPALQAPGWWQRPSRFHYGITLGDSGEVYPTPPVSPMSSIQEHPILLIIGDTGALGGAFARMCELRGLPYRLLATGKLDIADEEAVQSVMERESPWAVINAVDSLDVDGAEKDPIRCHREHVRGPAILAAACELQDARFVHFSSDLVFDGAKRAPYRESDTPRPLQAYGCTKLEGEYVVRSLLPKALIIRAGEFFSPWSLRHDLDVALHELALGKVVAANGQIVSPTYLPDLVNAALDLLIDEEEGIWHLANEGCISRADFLRQTAGVVPEMTGTVRDVGTEDISHARRPSYSALLSERAWIMPSLDDALERYAAECV